MILCAALVEGVALFGAVIAFLIMYGTNEQLKIVVEATKTAAGEDVTKLASMAKYMIGRLSMEVPVELTQFWGGQGFMNDNFITRVYREARQTAVGGGANEVMLQVIAKKMGIFPES